jgi:CheY-like chemotaxis protein
MIDELRARFRDRFIDTARERVRKSLALIGDAQGAETLTIELHSLAGEAALLGLTKISESARAGELAAREWSEGDESGKVRCARAVRLVSRYVEAFAREPVAATGEGEAPPRVLVVDDSTLSGEHVADALSDAGYRARLATEPITALRVADEFVPHIVLCDVHMPGVALADLCHKLHSVTSGRIRVVLFSAMSEENLARTVGQVGADGYITKERGIEHVIERVEAVLREFAQ